MMSRFKVVPPPREQVTFRPTIRATFRSPSLRDRRFRLKERFVESRVPLRHAPKSQLQKAYQKSLRSSSVTSTASRRLPLTPFAIRSQSNHNEKYADKNGNRKSKKGRIPSALLITCCRIRIAKRETTTWVSHGSARRDWRLPASTASHRGLLPHRGCGDPLPIARRFWRRHGRRRRCG
jgi:hypothetical protein